MEEYERKYLKRKSDVKKQLLKMTSPEQINIQRIYHELRNAMYNSDPAAVRVQERFYE